MEEGREGLWRRERRVIEEEKEKGYSRDRIEW